MLTLRAGALAALLLVGCAPVRHATGPAAGPAAPLDVPLAATLLRLEDQRLFDSAMLARAAAAPGAADRARAALALGRLRDPRGLPLLRPLLTDPDSTVTANAVFALALVGDTASAAWLVPLLAHDPARARPTVAAEAARTLGALVSGIGRRAVGAVLADSRSAGRADLPAALLASWRFTPAIGADTLAPWFRSPVVEVRRAAAYALGRRPRAHAVPALAAARDGDAETRSLAVRGLLAPAVDSRGYGRAAARMLLVSALGDSARPVRINAARALGSYAVDTAAAAALIAVLPLAEPDLLVTAIESLGRIGSAEAADVLQARAAARDELVPVRVAALEALARVAPDRGLRLAERLGAAPEWRLRAASGAVRARLLAATVARTNAALDDPDPRVVAAALGAAIYSIAPLRALLVEMTGRADVQVRTTVLNGLATLRDPALVPLLLDAFARAARDTVNDAALAAVDALGALPPTPRAAAARAFFSRFARSPDALVRLRARDRFGDTISASWGSPLPFDTSLDSAGYLALVRSQVAPVLAGAPRPRVLLATDRGEIEIELLPDVAPLTVCSFLALARRGYFDGQEWPRVVPNFVVQGGDPRGDTSGGPGYTIRDELNRVPYERGTVGMALSGPDTGGSQFFITLAPQPHLYGAYTVFGRVVRGLDVVDRIVQGDRILRIREVR